MCMSGAPSDPELERRAPHRSERLWLVAITLFGALLRVLYQVDRPFVGDDAGTLHYLDYDYAYLLTHFDVWLTMNWFMVCLKALRSALGDNPWVLVAPCLVVGIATIPVVHAFARRFLGARAALLAAFFVAINHQLVEFSVGLRSYMLLVCFSIVAMHAFFRWTDERTWRRGVVCAAWAAFALLMHPNAAYPMGFVAVLFVIECTRRRDAVLTIVVPGLVAAVVVALAYLPLREGMAAYRADWTVAAPSEWNYLPLLATRYFGIGWRAVPALALIGVGLWAAVRERRPMASLGLGVLVPMCLASALGVSTILGAYARFLSPILPLLILFLVLGIETVTRGKRVGVFALAALVAFTWLPKLENGLMKKERGPYAEVAAHLEALEPQEGEVISFDVSTKRFLVPYIGKEPFAALSRWARRSTSVRNPRLIVVASGPAFETDAPSKRFGTIQVVTYQGGNALRQVQRLHDDLLRMLDGYPVQANLTDHYGMMMKLLLALGRRDEMTRYTVGYYECFLRSSRLQDIPPQLFDVRDSISKHPIIQDILGVSDATLANE